MRHGPRQTLCSQRPLGLSVESHADVRRKTGQRQSAYPGAWRAACPAATRPHPGRGRREGPTVDVVGHGPQLCWRPPGIAAAKIVPRMDALKFQGILV
jgi:hypothetical protein